MPKQATHIISWSATQQAYELWSDGRFVQRFGVDHSSAWLHWIEQQTSFGFRGRHGRLSVVKEARARGTGYWYAYRSSGRRTAKRYLGRASELTPQRLEDIAASLAQLPGEPQRDEPTAAARPERIAMLLPKLSAPRLSATLVQRPRLLEQLAAGDDRPLTLVVAPAGFGKTTLVADWLGQSELRNENADLNSQFGCAWLSLDAGDDDPVRFWRYVISAFQTSRPSLGQAASEVLAAPLRPPFEALPLETAVTLLLNDLVQHLPNGVLVLDDYHVIAQPRIHETFAFFIDHLPPTLRVVLLARGEPPLPLLRWRAAGKLLEIPVAQLRFSRTETADFLGRLLPQLPGRPALERLDVQLEGWPAGLRLLALTLGARPSAVAEIERTLAGLDNHVGASRSRRALLEYFVSEILQAQPEPLQDFLLRTGVLGRLTGPLCDALTGGNDSALQLAAIERAGLFLEALDENGSWYRYHALWGQALRGEAHRRLGEATLRRLSLRASRWYEEHAMPDQAIDTALLADDPERAARLLERDDLDGRINEPLTVRRWLEQLPPAVLRRHPAVCLLAAQVFRFVADGSGEQPAPDAHRERIDTLLEMAEAGWLRQGRPELLGLIDAFRALSELAHGAIGAALEHARQALAVLPANSGDRSVKLSRGVSLLVEGIAILSEGRAADARPCFAEAHALSLAGSDRHFTNGMLLLLGLCSFIVGELGVAAEYYNRALPDARKHNDHEHTINALLGLASVALEHNELVVAEQYAHQALDLARDEMPTLSDRATCQLLLVRQARGETAAVRQQLPLLLARLQVDAPQDAQLLPYVLDHQARMLLEAGELEGAQRIAEALLRDEQRLDFAQRLAVQTLQARLLLAHGQPAAACLHLERLLAVAHEAQMARQILELELLLALATAAGEQPQAADAALRRALVLGSSKGYLNVFLAAGEPVARLLRGLAPAVRPPLRAYIRTILRASIASGDSSGGAGGWLAEPLSPQEQRVLRLLVAGHTNAEIAAQLVISANTVKDHVKRLYRKLGVRNRLQAGAAARELQLA